MTGISSQPQCGNAKSVVSGGNAADSGNNNNCKTDNIENYQGSVSTYCKSSYHKALWLSARWATELLWQPPEEYICEIVEMLHVPNVSYCILLENKLLLLN